MPPTQALCGPSRRVIVVELDPNTRSAVAQALQDEGFSVLIAPSLAAALTSRFWHGTPLILVARRPNPSPPERPDDGHPGA